MIEMPQFGGQAPALQQPDARMQLASAMAPRAAAPSSLLDPTKIMQMAKLGKSRWDNPAQPQQPPMIGDQQPPPVAMGPDGAPISGPNQQPGFFDRLAGVFNGQRPAPGPQPQPGMTPMDLAGGYPT